MQRFTLSLLLFLGLGCLQLHAQSYNPSEIKLNLEKLNTVGTVLYIAAHPDDENTRLLTYLSKEKHLRTCYLSLNRGEGGQNLIGKEQGAALGIIRTNELLQARKIDGAEQYFTRAIDFGYSKSPEETFTFWNHDSVLADVVYIIRLLQPDVIITRFPTTGEGGHGHHTASAILASEAFKMAADPKYFPEQLKSLKPWQAKTLYWNTFNFGNNNTQRDDQLKTDVGFFNTWWGKGCGEIAAQSRSQHKSQGFGVEIIRGSMLEYLKNIDGDTSCSTLFCKSDFSWNSVIGAETIKTLCETALAKFDMKNPASILPDLLRIHDELNKIQDNQWKKQKIKETEQLILACAGLWFDATSNQPYVTQGDSINIKLSSIVYSQIPTTIESISYLPFSDTSMSTKLEYNKIWSLEKSFVVPKSIPYSIHYWLKNKPESGRYVLDSQSMIEKPVNDAAFFVSVSVKISDHTLTFNLPVRYKWIDPVEGERYRTTCVVPPVAVNFNENVCLLINNKPGNLKLTVRSLSKSFTGKIKLDVPAGYKASPSEFEATALLKNERLIFNATIQQDAKADFDQSKTNQHLQVSILPSNTEAYSLQEIIYEHIPYQYYFKPSEVKIVPLQLQTSSSKIGYIEGAGDEVMQCLQNAGYNISVLKEENLSNDNLSNYSVIIAGVRAYNTNDWLMGYKNKLMDFVSSGGTYIVQYNTNNNLGKLDNNIGPYPFKISRKRVTDEYAEMRFSEANSIVLNKPNKINADDFKGWVQERGIYFAEEIDPKYQTPLSCNDKGESPLNGSLIIAQSGKGHFVYTGLAFFRQLPAGVSGAYRLFSNLIALPSGQVK
ncbi:MAG TPA: PIG-L family deacetylase [Bacteroidia bacterium]|nr:PIG-L family deacetylase [Bacteroidia bacterium]